MTPPAFIVHGLAEAVAVLAAAAGRPVMLVSPGYFDWLLFRAILEEARSAAPGAEVLTLHDPGPYAGYAAAALREGAPAVLWPGRGRQRAELQRLAEACGARLVTRQPPALDLAGAIDPHQAAARYLARRCRA